jgi:RimJ/RimL family protein N-acetyltransferase
MGFVDIDWRARCGTLGIAIWNPEGRGHGRGTEAVGLFCAWAFGVLNLRRVQLSVFANNPRAIRAYEKAGFQLEGRRRQARFWDGEYHDVLEMGLLRDELLK